MKLGNYCILCTDQKNLQSNSIKVWLTLFKNGNNLYENSKNGKQLKIVKQMNHTDLNCIS